MADTVPGVGGRSDALRQAGGVISNANDTLNSPRFTQHSAGSALDAIRGRSERQRQDADPSAAYVTVGGVTMTRAEFEAIPVAKVVPQPGVQNTGVAADVRRQPEDSSSASEPGTPESQRSEQTQQREVPEWLQPWPKDPGSEALGRVPIRRTFEGGGAEDETKAIDIAERLWVAEEIQRAAAMSAGDLSKTMPNNADTQLALGLQLGVIKDSLGIEATSLADIEAAIGKPDVIPVLDVEKTLAEGQKLIDAGIPGSSMKLVCVPGGFVHDPSREKKISTTLMRLAQHPELIENPSNDFERAIVESYRRALETFPDMEPDGHRQTWSYEQTRPFEASFMKHLDELAPVTGKARPYGTASIFAGALLGMRAMFGSRYEYNPRPVRDHLTYDLTLEPGGDFRSINVYDSTQPLRKLMTQATWVLVFDNEGVDGKRVFPKRNMPDEYLQPMPLCVGAVLLKLTDPEAGTVIPCIESVQAPDDSAKPNPGENMPLSLRYGDQYGGSIKLCELSRSFKRRADHVGWVNLG